MTTFETVTLGRIMSVEFQLFKYIVNGVTLTLSDDFIGKTVIEPEIFGRWYFLSFAFGGSLFLQGDLGMSLLVEKSNSEPRFLAGITTGFRYFFGRTRDYFVEPYVKGGYPFIIGFGLKAGCRL
ncbi:MAG: hypothetical protein LBD29_10750 [Treponema sp.]|nr:hypothetical protein [Treponema sp.]